MSDSGRKVDIVAAAIEEAISTGRWPVGSKLPPETALVEELGVARNTMREAVRALAHAGVLSVRHGGGVYVMAASPVEGLLGRRLARGGRSRRTEPATRTRGRSRATCSAAPHPRRSRADTCSLECPPRSRRRLHCRSRHGPAPFDRRGVPQFRTDRRLPGSPCRRDGFAVRSQCRSRFSTSTSTDP